jgi:hypothetical protein
MPAGILVRINTKTQLVLDNRKQALCNLPHMRQMPMSPHEPVAPFQLIKNVRGVYIDLTHFMASFF